MMPTTTAGRIAHAILPAPAFSIAQNAWRALQLPSVLQRVLPHTPAGDQAYHWLRFWHAHGRFPSAQAMMLNDFLYRLKASATLADPMRVLLTDKEHVKEYVCEKCGPGYTVPTLAVIHAPEDVETFQYPERCVIKPTHLSGPIIFRRSPETVDTTTIRKWFSLNHYYGGPREKNYRELVPKVIIEPFAFDQDRAADDYKIFCWRGDPKVIQIDLARFGEHRRAYFDTTWSLIPVTREYPLPDPCPPAPKALPTMLYLAEKLSADFKFIRVDLYASGTRAVVGELTHCPETGEFFFDGNGEEIISRILFAQH